MHTMLKALSVLLVFLAACKAQTPAGSKIKTLVEVATAGEFGSAICKGSGQNAQASRQFLEDGGVDDASFAEFETAASALAALPPALLVKLKSVDTTLQLTVDPAAYCIQALAKGQQALGKSDACYIWTKRNGQPALDIAIRGHWGKIGTTLVKEIGYVVAQNSDRLVKNSTGFAKDKDRVVQAFLRDMVSSRVFAVKGLTPLLGDNGVVSLINAAKGSDADRDLLDGVSQARRTQITDFVFAEAFDSFYCRSADSVTQSDANKLQNLAISGGSKATAKSVIASVSNTRLAMKVLFPRAHAAFLNVHDKYWPSASGGFALDTPIEANVQVPSSFPYADSVSSDMAGASAPSALAELPVSPPDALAPMDFSSTTVTPSTGMALFSGAEGFVDDNANFDRGDAGVDATGFDPPAVTDSPANTPTTGSGSIPEFRPTPLTGGAFTSLPHLYDDKIDYDPKDNSREAVMERINARAKELEANPALAEERLMKRDDYSFSQEALEAAGLKDKCGNLSPAECLGVFNYTQQDYFYINKQARANEPPIYRPSGSARRIDGQARAEDGYVNLLQQRVVLESALTKLEGTDAGYRGTVNRWTDLPPEVAAGYTPGAKVKFDGFTSTTIISDEADLPPSLKSLAESNTRFIIEDARGANIEQLSAYGTNRKGNEREILLRPTSMEVLSTEVVTLPSGKEQRLVRLKQVHEAAP